MGIILPDNTNNRKLMSLLRKMRRFNPIPHVPTYGSGFRNIIIGRIVEDPNFRESANSYFIQAADLLAYLIYQAHKPCSYMKKKNGHNYYRRLNPIFCRHASMSNPNGFVRL